MVDIVLLIAYTIILQSKPSKYSQIYAFKLFHKNESPVSRAGSFVTPSGLLSQSSLGDDGLCRPPGSSARPQAEAPPVDKEGTLRNTDWLEADRTRKAEAREGRADLGARSRIPEYGSAKTRDRVCFISNGVGELCLLRNKQLSRFDDVNKKEQKGATFGDGSGIQQRITQWLPPLSMLTEKDDVTCWFARLEAVS
ncbi:hypothetical protein Tsp_09961 [Trichinella spiralis]|uniref:hypothetical protein n=1 Tax=Trichinella spiralis TaxID=6334 RepID=UPI0001EFE1F8|nr:hypothetical protein Tsp_09961 [Trichinella spiralis]